MNRIIVLCFLSIIESVVFADQFTTSCITESNGVTSCKAVESSQKTVMNLSCNNSSGKSSCSGQYFDEKTSNLDFNCSIDVENMRIKCGGGSGKDKFSLDCGPADLEFGKLGCLATDGSGESLKVLCDMTTMVDGVPDCSRFDAKGEKHSISCKSDSSGKTACSID